MDRAQAGRRRASHGLGSDNSETPESGHCLRQSHCTELNEREIPTARDGKWYKSTVRRLLRRIDTLDGVSRSRHRL